MRKFKIGQEAVCLNDQGWVDDTTGEKVVGPIKNELVTITGFESDHYIILKGYSINEGYADHCFEPVIDISELQEILNQEFATL